VGKLAASILSADLAHLAAQVKLVEDHADLIHIDMMDGRFVPPLTIGPPVVASLRPHTALTLHAHLQVEAPEGLVDDLAEAGADAVSFQVEAVADPAPLLRKVRGTAMRAGLALAPPTPIEPVMEHLDEVDDVVVLAVQPGWAGQPFRPEVLAKVRLLREAIDRRRLAVDVHVDGGVGLATARACLDAGATVLVAASAIYGTDDPSGAARDLKRIVEAA
jgi:ribulose-phosphate 3-epimerase